MCCQERSGDQKFRQLCGVMYRKRGIIGSGRRELESEQERTTVTLVRHRLCLHQRLLVVVEDDGGEDEDGTER